MEKSSNKEKSKSELVVDRNFHVMHESKDEFKRTMANERFKQEITKTIREVGEFSLTPGISSITRSEWPVKILWIAFELFLLCIAAYLVTTNVQNYLKHEVTTQIREISEFPSYFPTITLCNINYFTAADSFQYLKDVAGEYELNDIFYNQNAYNQNPYNQNPYNQNANNQSAYNQNESITCENYISVVESYQSVGTASVIISNLSRAEIQKLGYEMKDVLLSCNFGSSTCNYTDFEWFFHPNYGYLFITLYI